jgi:SOS-response transcriptional repressor LexA
MCTESQFMLGPMATIGEKIRHLRSSRRPRMSQSVLAMQLGVTRSQLANYETDRTLPTDAVVRKLSRIWAVPENWFWDGGALDPPDPGIGTSPTTATPGVGFTRGVVPGAGRRLFPVVGTAGAAAFPVESRDGADDYVEFSDDLYRPDRFVIQVVGDSMSPRLKHGDFVLVHPDPNPPYGLLTVARSSEYEYCVKVRRRASGRDVLEPLNPDYEAIDIEHGWQIVGYAVGIREERGRRKYREEGDDDGLRP